MQGYSRPLIKTSRLIIKISLRALLVPQLDGVVLGAREEELALVWVRDKARDYVAVLPVCRLQNTGATRSQWRAICGMQH